MSRRPIAEVRVMKVPHVHPDALRIEIDCKYSTTGLTSIPRPHHALTKAQMITAAVFEHEARCGDCVTSDAHRQGDGAIREQTERVWNQVKQAMARRYAESVRN
jgi:hypothetical protein